jgi:hypothetical protein
MSYDIQCQGWFEFADKASLEATLKVIDETAEEYAQTGEESLINKHSYMKIKNKHVTIDVSGSIPAGMFYGTEGVLYELSLKASAGEVKLKSTELQISKRYKACARISETRQRIKKKGH